MTQQDTQPGNEVFDQEPLSPITERLRNIVNLAGKAACTAFVVGEILPLTNEGLRLAAFTAAQATLESPPMSALAFTAATFAIEGAGAVATAKLMDTKTSNHALEWAHTKTNKVLSKFGKEVSSDNEKNGNATVETAIALVAGVPTMLTLKQLTDPSRTSRQNIRSGLVSSAIISGITGGESYLAAEGLTHPNALTIVGALGGVGLIGAGVKMVRERVQAKSPLYNYFNLIKKAQPGPQLEGVMPEELVDALRDNAAVFMDMTNPDRKKTQQLHIPAAIPVRYASWINDRYLQSKGFDPDKTFYCTLPQSVLSQFDQAEVRQQFEGMSVDGVRHLIIDYDENITLTTGLQEAARSIDDLTTANGTEAAVYYYNADVKAKPQQEGSAYVVDNHVKRITAEDLDHYFDQLWAIYESQFQGLVDDHPVNGMIPRADLYDSFQKDGCRLSAYFDDQEKIMAFGYIVDDLEICPWLNEDYITSQNPDLPTLYMPGIASSKEARGVVSTKIMNQILEESLQIYNGEFHLTFECSNKSARYIPRIVRRAFDQSNLATLSDFHELRHLYKVVDIG